MELQPAQLAALVAIADHGTFEAAARAPARDARPPSASGSGRSSARWARWSYAAATPCEPTDAGADAAPARRGRPGCSTTRCATRSRTVTVTTVDLPVAVNADSLATWFRGVLGEVAGWADVALRLHVEDQACSADAAPRR